MGRPGMSKQLRSKEDQTSECLEARNHRLCEGKTTIAPNIASHTGEEAAFMTMQAWANHRTEHRLPWKGEPSPWSLREPSQGTSPHIKGEP